MYLLCCNGLDNFQDLVSEGADESDIVRFVFKVHNKVLTRCPDLTRERSQRVGSDALFVEIPWKLGESPVTDTQYMWQHLDVVLLLW